MFKLSIYNRPKYVTDKQNHKVTCTLYFQIIGLGNYIQWGPNGQLVPGESGKPIFVKAVTHNRFNHDDNVGISDWAVYTEEAILKHLIRKGLLKWNGYTFEVTGEAKFNPEDGVQNWNKVTGRHLAYERAQMATLEIQREICDYMVNLGQRLIDCNRWAMTDCSKNIEDRISKCQASIDYIVESTVK